MRILNTIGSTRFPTTKLGVLAAVVAVMILAGAAGQAMAGGCGSAPGCPRPFVPRPHIHPPSMGMGCSNNFSSCQPAGVMPWNHMLPAPHSRYTTTFDPVSAARISAQIGGGPAVRRFLRWHRLPNGQTIPIHGWDVYQ